MADLTSGKKSLLGADLQSAFLDCLESEDYNVFLNTESGEKIYALSCKRGNVVYATRKTIKKNELLKAAEGRAFDWPVPGFRNRRMTRLLFVTLSFDHEQFSMEEAWAALRAKPIEGRDCKYNVINSLDANFRKIFGPHGKLVCKEAQKSGYPAPHMILLLDNPVMVEQVSTREGMSWRICNQRILNRIGKGPLMRKLSFKDHRKAISMNPIWKHGFIDVKGIVKLESEGRRRNALTYPFKYLTKCLIEDNDSKISAIKTINEISDKDLRTTLFTHLGNKCFRTRDISFGKGFKDRIGLLPEESVSEGSCWKHMSLICGELKRYIDRMTEKQNIRWLRDSLLRGGVPCET